MKIYQKIQSELKKIGSPQNAKTALWFFKTGPGEYGAGDKFLGVKNPQQRAVAKKYYRHTSLSDAQKLLLNPFHEVRQTALFILVNKFTKSTEADKEKIYQLYLKNTKRVNNWDLVDLSAPAIAGAWLFDKNRSVLYRLAHSNNLWEKRIAILSTYYFIRQNQFDDTLKIARILLEDRHDLIHKAVGWMLREVGKRDLTAEEKFLKKHAGQMPRTALRYSIEKFPKNKRRYFLNYEK